MFKMSKKEVQTKVNKSELVIIVVISKPDEFGDRSVEEIVYKRDGIKGFTEYVVNECFRVEKYIRSDRDVVLSIMETVQMVKDSNGLYTDMEVIFD